MSGGGYVRRGLCPEGDYVRRRGLIPEGGYVPLHLLI